MADQNVTLQETSLLTRQHCAFYLSPATYGFGATVATDADKLTVTLALVLCALQHQATIFVTI